jgi:N-acetylglucosamine kinase-like BadF-type ATPase
MAYVLGVDGGNTKTIALVARLGGEIVGAGRGGPGDIYNPASGADLPNVRAAVRQALDAAGLSIGELAGAALSMAGADWPEDFEHIAGIARGHGLGCPLEVFNDAIGALRAGSPDGTGLVVACGTAAAVGARTAEGRVWHTSFWQGVGGGDDLGRQALSAIYRAELGIDPPTALSDAILARTGAPSVEELLHRRTARGHAPEERGPGVGALARVLLDVAERGDATARAIVCGHGAALGDYALAAARRAGLPQSPFPLVLAGGVLRHPSRLLSDALTERVRAAYPAVEPVNSRFEPAIGALFLALEAAGAPVGPELIARMEPTLPSHALFET